MTQKKYSVFNQRPEKSSLFRLVTVASGLLLTFVLVASLPAWAMDPAALPTGGQVTAGQGSIATSGSQMTINQSSNRMITQWETFNIGSQAAVAFQQPSASSVALNRIQDTLPSQIFGRLSANGQIFLLNPAGIVFGPTARVDVGGLVASSLNLSDEAFFAGDYHFNGAGGSIFNQGTIRTADGGYVAFIAPHVENAGAVEAPGGTVFMGAGERVQLDFTGDSLVNYVVERGAVDALVENNGAISAAGGTVVLSAEAADSLTRAVVNHTGVIEAQSLENRNGRIVLRSDMETGEVNITGAMDVSGAEAGATGGKVTATAATVTLTDGATINASGSSGGGAIFVGGGWQGSDASIANATTVNADDTISIYADALDQGDGGTVVFWSDDTTLFAGTIFVRGGVLGGDGGQAEVSGKQMLAYSGVTDARAPLGLTGDLLLDPASINIVDGGTGSGAITGSTVYEKDLEAQLANITLQATGTSYSDYIRLNDLTTDGVITLQPNINLTIIAGDYFSSPRQYVYYQTADTNDEIRASGSGQIYIRAAASITSGKLTSETGKITLWGDNGLTVGNIITTNGGAVELWADSDNLGGGQLTLNQAVTTNGGDVDLDAGYSGVIVNAPVSTGAGRLYFDRLGTVRNATYRVSAKISATGNINLNQNLQFGAGAEIETTGALTITGTSSMQNSSASLTLTASNFDFQQSITGNGASVTIKPYNAATNVDIGAAGTGDMTFSSTNFSRLTGFANVTVGRSDGTGTTKVLGDTSVATSGYLELANKTVDITGGTLANTGGDIILTGDSFSVSKSVTAKNGTGKVSLRQMTAGNPITLGSGVTNTVLDQISAGTLEVGRIDGGNVTFDGNITTSTSALNVLSGGNITLGSGVTLNVGTGTATLAAVGHFINNSGSSAITTSGAGRWLIYSAGPSGDTFGGLSSGNNALWHKTYAGYPPTSVSETGNRYLFSTQPSLTFTAANKTKTYGQAVDLSSPAAGADYTVSGLIDAATYGNVFTQDTYSGAPSLASAGAAATASVAGSAYAITIAANTLTNPTGYGAATFTNGALTVNKAALTVTAANDSKTYSGNTYSGGNGVTYSGFVNSETAAVLGGTLAYGGTSQGAKNAGTYAITPSGLTSGNYALTFANGALTINKAALTVTAANDSRTYNGNTYSGGNGVSYSGFVNSETATVLGGTLAYGGTSQGAKNAGTYTITPSGLTSGNYDISFANGALTINKAALTVTAANDSRTYNGNTYSGGNGVSYSGFVNSETATVLGGTLAYGGTSQGAKNAGTYAITPSGLTSGNYDLSFANGALTINKAALTVTAANDSRTYNGNTYSGGNGVTYSGFVNSETAAVLGGTLAYGGTSQGAKNAGTYAITPSGLTSGNYALTFANGALTINKAALTVTAANDSRTYNGNTYSGGNGVSYSGFVNSETATVLGGTLAYGGTSQGAKNAGTYAITPSGLTSGNYDLSFANGALTINKAALSITAQANTKVYDGGVTSAASPAVSGLVGTDTISGLSQAYADKNVGNGKTLAISAYTINDGNGGNNYTVTAVNNTSGVITAKSLAASYTASNKVYDATTAATVAGSSSDIIAGDTVNFSQSAAFTDKNVGNGKTVNVSAISLSGADAGNYSLQSTTATTTATITQKALTASYTASNKVYDGTAAATVAGSSSDIIAGDAVTFGQSAAFTDKNVGNGKTVNVSSISLSGTDGGNYSLQNTSTTTTANIAVKNIDATGISAEHKIYDGTTEVTIDLESAGLSGVVTGDAVTLDASAASGAFEDRYVDADKTVEVTGLTLSGADVANYALNNYTTTASIAPVDITDNLVSPQKAVNGTQVDQGSQSGATAAAAFGPGSGSTSLGAVSSGSLVNLAPQTGGGTVLSASQFTAPVSFSASGSTTTLALGAGAETGAMVEVGALPVFNQSGLSAPVAQGSVVVREGAAALSVTAGWRRNDR